MNPNSSNSLASRRTFLRGAAGAGLGISTLPTTAASAIDAGTADAPQRRPGQRSMIGVPFEQHNQVRLGVVGVGNRGYGMLAQFLNVPNALVTAIADHYEPRARSAAARVVAAGQPEPAIHAGNDDSYEALCARDDVDFVYNATPWEWHHPVAVAAMNGGKHVGVELPLAMTLHDLWELVDTSERTRRHCIQLENVSYGQNELRLLRMAHDGLFGELLHGAGGYVHDLRHNLFFRANRDSDELGVTYRRIWNTKLNACHYPNHGLAPIAACMDINRGDRFVSLSSTTTPALGLAAFRKTNVPEDHPSWDETYINGDRNTCLIETHNGRHIRVEHDVTSPHPYTRINSIAGTHGVFEDFIPTRDESRIYLEPDMFGDLWGSWDNYADYDHWLWKEIGGGDDGHGGIDYLTAWRLVQTMRLGLVPDIDVYDSAAWSAPVALSALSLQAHGTPIPFPDFTRGRWQEYRPGLDTTRPLNR